MDYIEKLKDPRWQKKRLEILNKYNWKCMHCGSTNKELHLHHRKYDKEKEPWEYKINDIFVLCKDCHFELHKAVEWFACAFVIANKKQLLQISDFITKLLEIDNG